MALYYLGEVTERRRTIEVASRSSNHSKQLMQSKKNESTALETSFLFYIHLKYKSIQNYRGRGKLCV